jgi:2-dehydro-3-deoxyphosphogluconate aldolase / (4S)-4-hydroxy-2-oxoglutarate aldolase
MLRSGSMAPDPLMQALAADRAVAVLRAPQIAAPAELAAALTGVGMHFLEFTFTAANVLDAIEQAARAGAIPGAGTVLSADQAERAIERGAQFLVSPCVVPEVGAVCQRAGVAAFIGAFSPTEVLAAHHAGASAVKIFPAGIGGPRYLKDLAGPFPELSLMPSGGVDEGNAAAFLAAGAIAVSAGSSVAPPDLLQRGDHEQIAARAASFLAALEPAAAGQGR